MALSKCSCASGLRSVALQDAVCKLLCAVALRNLSAQVALFEWLFSMALCEAVQGASRKLLLWHLCSAQICTSISRAPAPPHRLLSAICPAQVLCSRYSLQVAIFLSALHKRLAQLASGNSLPNKGANPLSCFSLDIFPWPLGRCVGRGPVSPGYPPASVSESCSAQNHKTSILSRAGQTPNHTLESYPEPYLRFIPPMPTSRCGHVKQNTRISVCIHIHV